MKIVLIVFEMNTFIVCACATSRLLRVCFVLVNIY